MSLKRTVLIALGWVVLASTAGSLRARQIEDWPYDKLFKHADLVVIVKPLSVRDATEKDKAAPPEAGKDYLVGIVTKFAVLHVVKGEYKEKELGIVHFKLKKGVVVGNGPLLASFYTKRLSISGDFGAATMKPEYMLFLKKQEDGRFTFVSGQFDPELSVKQMLSPLP
jgi:hypothetical protein